MTDIDIKRLKENAKELAQITHSGRPDLVCGKECKLLYYHQSCAIVALIERLEEAEEQVDKFKWKVRDTCCRAEKAEAQRDRLEGAIAKLLTHIATEYPTDE